MVELMRRYALLLACSCLLACPKVPGEKSSATDVGMTTGVEMTETAGVETTAGLTSGTGVTASTSGTTGEKCGGSFVGPPTCVPPCGPDEVCRLQGGDAISTYCDANPEGCVPGSPGSPCSPECAAHCGPDRLCGASECGVLVCSSPVSCSVGDDGFLSCPDGEKCAPADRLGKDTWNGTLCVPVDPMPGAVGEPCTIQGKTGVDTCERDAVCWEGVCAAMCDTNGLGCPQGTFCVEYVYDVLRLCEPTCHPLMPQCPAGEECIGVKTSFEAGFACVPDQSGAGGQAGDPCEKENQCDPGQMCSPSDEAPSCAGASGCCTPYCDVMQPNTCPLPGQVCEPWYPMNPPPGLENVGVCRVPS